MRTKYFFPLLAALLFCADVFAGISTGPGGTLSGTDFAKTPLQFSTNALSLWPTSAASDGGFAVVNSNGTPYVLLSSPGSTTWTSTNQIIPTIGISPLSLSGTNCAVDVSLVNVFNNTFTLVATTNVFFVAPQNVSEGKRFSILFTEDSTGTWTRNFDTNYWKAQGAYYYPATTNAGATDVMDCIVSGTNVLVSFGVDFR